jgi:hypothetical protein
MQGGSLTKKDNTTAPHQVTRMISQATENDLAVSHIDAAAKASSHSLWLFKDFLEHVVLVSTKFDLIERHF